MWWLGDCVGGLCSFELGKGGEAFGDFWFVVRFLFFYGIKIIYNLFALMIEVPSPISTSINAKSEDSRPISPPSKINSPPPDSGSGPPKISKSSTNYSSKNHNKKMTNSKTSKGNSPTNTTNYSLSNSLNLTNNGINVY